MFHIAADTTLEDREYHLFGSHGFAVINLDTLPLYNELRYLRT
jgi:hypothetical protein